MRSRGCVLGLLLASAGAMAQSTPQAGGAGDVWQPAASSSIRYQSAPRSLGGEQGRFNFRPREPQAPSAPAGSPFDKAAAGSGMPQIQSDGRPALNCMQNPRDPRCH